MKVLSILAMLVGSAVCSLEPAGHRLSSTYLPPNVGGRSSSLSSSYLPASSHTYSAPPSNYHQQPSYQRSQNTHQRSQDTYQIPSYQPSREYKTVSSSTYLPPSSRNSHQGSSVRSNRYIPSPPKDTLSLPELADLRSSILPAASYGVPEYNDTHYRDHHHHNHEDDYSSEPAKYDFAYQVNDNYGNDYSHQESRNGAKTRGSYSVLLPDGRKQIVEYEADEAGYRPKISYENVQTDRAAYPGGGPY